MMEQNTQTTTWPELAIGLYDALTGRNAEITYDFQNFEVNVPSSTSTDASYANWKINGVLKNPNHRRRKWIRPLIGSLKYSLTSH